MAPEQILGGEVDRRCDVFAAGIVLYFLSTGRHPFKHHNTAGVIHSITNDEPVAPPSSVVPDYPPELEKVVLKALEKDVTKRWATAEDMRVALERAMPDAFDDGGDAALREFMQRMLGDRKVARREAVRRAQLAADARDVESGTRKALQTTAQSASSLRAISISQPAPDAAVEAPSDAEAAAEQRRTLRAPDRKRRMPKAPFMVAALGLALAGVVVLSKLASHTPAPVQAASHGLQAPPAAAAAQPAFVTPSAESSAPTAAPTKPVSPATADVGHAAALEEGRVAPVLSSSAAPRAPLPAKRKPTGPLKKAEPVKSDAREELLTPDYAR
jgi:serine/threonine-protein kinase